MVVLIDVIGSIMPFVTSWNKNNKKQALKHPIRCYFFAKSVHEDLFSGNSFISDKMGKYTRFFSYSFCRTVLKLLMKLSDTTDSVWKSNSRKVGASSLVKRYVK